MSSRLMTRIAASVIAAAAIGGAVATGSGTAGATAAQDEQFANILTQLDIPHENPEQAALLGNHICRLLAENGAGGPNPVPVVRGVVTTLTNGGLQKGQAVQVMRASAAVYCPQFASVMGR